MPSETLHFENARFAQQLLNNDAQTLHTLEQILGIKATTREGWIKLEGSEEALGHAKQLFQILESSLKAGRHATVSIPITPIRPGGRTQMLRRK